MASCRSEVFPLLGWIPMRLIQAPALEPGPLTMCCLPLAQCKRLEGGLDKLKEATIQLDELNQKLAEQKIVLAEKSAACEALLDEIATNTAIGECLVWTTCPGANLHLRAPGCSKSLLRDTVLWAALSKP